MSWLPSWLNGSKNNGGISPLYAKQSEQLPQKKNSNVLSNLGSPMPNSLKANNRNNNKNNTMRLGNITYKKNNMQPMFSTTNVMTSRMEEAGQPVNAFTRRRALAELPALKQQLERYAHMYTGKTLAELETAHPIYRETLYLNPPVQELLEKIAEYESQLGKKGGKRAKRHRRKTYKK